MNNSCCEQMSAEYHRGLDAIPELKSKLDEKSRSEIRPGYIVRDYQCRQCGQRWRYEQEVVGHADVDERVLKI